MVSNELVNNGHAQAGPSTGRVKRFEESVLLLASHTLPRITESYGDLVPRSGLKNDVQLAAAWKS